MSGKASKIFALFGMEIAILLFLLTGALLYRECSSPSPLFTLESGVYNDNLILAGDPSTTEISAIYKDGEGCHFYLVGKLTEDKFNIVTWHPEDNKGEKQFGILELHGNNRFSVFLEKIPGFCPSGKDFTVNSGVEFVLTTPKPWQRLRSVKFDDSIVYASPDTSSRKVITLDKFDLTKVIDKNLLWVKVTYGENDEFTGWIEKDRLYRFPG